MAARKDKQYSYVYDEEIGNYSLGPGNPMRPHRARLVKNILEGYGLLQYVRLQRPVPRTFEQITQFHADDYINFLRKVTPNNVEDHLQQLRRYNMGKIGDVDCPVFDGVFEYCQMYAGGSVMGAAQLANQEADVVFNWSGGMHHAKRAEASGFCYVNDIVLAILELLKVFPRVLYVDIDIHHGDGVEEAFYLTDRVMTVSFHKYGEFFPGTGALSDVGYNKGKNYCVNVPMKDGMDDESYKSMFEPILGKVMEVFQPSAVVMCCGADSLSGDRLGSFNLSIEGHSNCIEFLSRYNVPMLLLGGGGYTLRNVSRCWSYETGRIMGVDLPDELPVSSLRNFNYYFDTGCLRINVSNMKNMNSKEDLDAIRTEILQNLSQLPPVPSVQMAYVPPQHEAEELPEEDMEERGGGREREEARRVRAGDESDDEDDVSHGGVQCDVTPPAANTPTPYTTTQPSPPSETAAQQAAVRTPQPLQPIQPPQPTDQPSAKARASAAVIVSALSGKRIEEVNKGGAMQPATLATSEALRNRPADASSTGIQHSPRTAAQQPQQQAVNTMPATNGGYRAGNGVIGAVNGGSVLKPEVKPEFKAEVKAEPTAVDMDQLGAMSAQHGTRTWKAGTTSWPAVSRDQPWRHGPRKQSSIPSPTHAAAQPTVAITQARLDAFMKHVLPMLEPEELDVLFVVCRVLRDAVLALPRGAHVKVHMPPHNMEAARAGLRRANEQARRRHMFSDGRPVVVHLAFPPRSTLDMSPQEVASTHLSALNDLLLNDLFMTGHTYPEIKLLEVEALEASCVLPTPLACAFPRLDHLTWVSGMIKAQGEQTKHEALTILTLGESCRVAGGWDLLQQLPQLPGLRVLQVPSASLSWPTWDMDTAGIAGQLLGLAVDKIPSRPGPHPAYRFTNMARFVRLRSIAITQDDLEDWCMDALMALPSLQAVETQKGLFLERDFSKINGCRWTSITTCSLCPQAAARLPLTSVMRLQLGKPHMLPFTISMQTAAGSKATAADVAQACNNLRILRSCSISDTCKVVCEPDPVELLCKFVGALRPMSETVILATSPGCTAKMITVVLMNFPRVKAVRIEGTTPKDRAGLAEDQLGWLLTNLPPSVKSITLHQKLSTELARKLMSISLARHVQLHFC